MYIGGRFYFYEMALQIIQTADGSSSFYNEELDETYHSRHGAIQEAAHVFIKMGLEAILKHHETINLMEIGFGTGLNAWLSAINAIAMNKRVDYLGVEAYPISEGQVASLNYHHFSDSEEEKLLFNKIHEICWEEKAEIHPYFSLTKRKQDFKDIEDTNTFDLIYFDAFGPRVQPELWTEEIFTKMYKALKDKGILVTYSAKGDVRRAMIKVGFNVEKVPGPPGKREMLLAKKG